MQTSTSKYIITSPNWEGEIRLEYDYQDRLVGYVLDAELSPAQYAFFIEHFPHSTAAANALLTSVPSLRARMIPHDLDFQVFWNSYDYKVGNKQRSDKLWNAMSDKERIECLESIKHYDRYLQYKKSIEKNYPETYLSQRRWETDYKKLLKSNR